MVPVHAAFVANSSISVYIQAPSGTRQGGQAIKFNSYSPSPLAPESTFEILPEDECPDESSECGALLLNGLVSRAHCL